MKTLILNGSPRKKGKPAIIVTACLTPWPLNRILKMSSGVIKSVKIYLKPDINPGEAADKFPEWFDKQFLNQLIMSQVRYSFVK